MNYRHVYHAGNFADVLKHAVLARVLVYLQNKDAAVRILDTHAGLGLYDLTSEEAQKTGEWRDGIGRLLDAKLARETAALLAPYLDAVRSLNLDGPVRRYPGSPKLARMLMRRQDRLSAIEMHPADAAALQKLFPGDHQVRVTRLDGWLALGGHLPPKEKRGLVLIDPPFEEPGEFDRMLDGLARAHRRFAGGCYCLWYPLKAGAPAAHFHERLAALGIRRVLACELRVRDEASHPGLAGSGMVIVNPPFTLAAELHAMLPELARILAQDRSASARTGWLVGEDGTTNLALQPA